MVSAEQALKSWGFAPNDRVLKGFMTILKCYESCGHPEVVDEIFIAAFDPDSPGVKKDCRALRATQVSPLRDMVEIIERVENLDVNKPANIKSLVSHDNHDFFLLPHAEGKDFNQVAEEKIVAFIQGNKRALIASLEELLSGFLKKGATEELSYVKLSAAHAHHSPIKVLGEIYGKVSDDVFIAPSRFLHGGVRIEHRNIFALCYLSASYNFSPDMIKENKSEAFMVLGNCEIEASAPVRDTDDTAVIETFKEFINNLPFEQALAAARTV